MDRVFCLAVGEYRPIAIARLSERSRRFMFSQAEEVAPGFHPYET
jgi:hypothetical protein